LTLISRQKNRRKKKGESSREKKKRAPKVGTLKHEARSVVKGGGGKRKGARNQMMGQWRGRGIGKKNWMTKNFQVRKPAIKPSKPIGTDCIQE